MSATIDFNSVAPEAARPLFEAGRLLAESGLEPALLSLVQLRASQLNRCAFCLALHAREAQALGESGDRLSGLAAWREAPWYSARERAALEWTEDLTLIAREHPPHERLAMMREHFTDREIVYLTLAVSTINAWNRLNVAFQTSPAAAGAVFDMLHAQDGAARA